MVLVCFIKRLPSSNQRGPPFNLRVPLKRQESGLCLLYGIATCPQAPHTQDAPSHTCSSPTRTVSGSGSTISVVPQAQIPGLLGCQVWTTHPKRLLSLCPYHLPPASGSSGLPSPTVHHMQPLSCVSASAWLPQPRRHSHPHLVLTPASSRSALNTSLCPCSATPPFYGGIFQSGSCRY